MHELVSNKLKKLNIDITKCTGNSTDGAANKPNIKNSPSD